MVSGEGCGSVCKFWFMVKMVMMMVVVGWVGLVWVESGVERRKPRRRWRRKRRRRRDVCPGLVASGSCGLCVSEEYQELDHTNDEEDVGMEIYSIYYDRGKGGKIVYANGGV